MLIMTTNIRRCAVTAFAALILAACSTNAEPDEAACKSAINEQIYVTFEGDEMTLGWPKECKGLNKATLDRLAEEVVDENDKG